MPDLGAYFDRIAFTGSRSPTVDTLSALQLLHPAAIAFENLDPFLGREVSLDIAAVEAKLVRRRRGGYCFEHNALFHDVLAALGFTVTALAGRFVWGMAEGAARPPLTHRFTAVNISGEQFIADVGFGGTNPTGPIRLDIGVEQSTPHGLYRVTQDDGEYQLEHQVRGCWTPLYRFTLDRQGPRDFELGNWFTSTHPQSRFRTDLTVAKIEGGDRIHLRNALFTIYRGDGRADETVIKQPEEFEELLTGRFGIDLPAAVDEIWRRLPPAPI